MISEELNKLLSEEVTKLPHKQRRFFESMIFMNFPFFAGYITPWKINMEPTNHPFRKENDLPNLHDYGPS